MYGLLWILTRTIYGIYGNKNKMKIWNLRVPKNLNVEKITWKVVQITFLAMHVTLKMNLDIVTVGYLAKI